MKRKRAVLLLLAAVLLLLPGLSACGKRSGGDQARYTEDGRVILRVSMYNSSSYPLWRAYVENNCPDVFIQWENNRNSAANVLYLAEHGDMPDLVSIRRFECDTAAALRPYLADLSSLEIASGYSQTYLKPFSDEGKTYWLPGPGVFDGIVANTDLFSQYGIELPTDLDSFIAACAKLETHGVAVFAADCAEPWSPTQMLQGFGASVLTGSGSAWVQSFEAGTADSVDPASCAQIASVIRLLHEKQILTQQDLDSTAADTNSMLISGKAAMVRKNSDEKFDAASSHHYAALPFFGETADDSWLYTYPVFSLALSAGLEEDPALQAAGEEVLSVMLSDGAQQVLNSGGEGLISYNGCSLPLSDAMGSVRDLIDQGKYFVRILNANTFSANTRALTALLADNATDAEFCAILNENLFREPDTAVIARSTLSAGTELDSERCCPAASVVAQVLQAQTGTDCALIDMRETPSALFDGDYSSADIAAVVLPSRVYTARLNAGQLQELAETSILCATTFQSGQIEPIVEYPAASGMTIRMQADGTVLGVSLNGKADGGWQTCRVAVSGNIYAALVSQGSSLAGVFTLSDANLKEIFTDGFRTADALPEPQHYYSVG